MRLHPGFYSVEYHKKGAILTSPPMKKLLDETLKNFSQIFEVFLASNTSNSMGPERFNSTERLVLTMTRFAKEFWIDRRILFLFSALLAYVLLTLRTDSSRWTWAAIGAGVVFFFFLEYITHRFILHGFLAKFMDKAFQGHEEHHDHPEDIRFLLTPNSFNIPLHILLWGLFCLVTWSIHIGSAIMIGTCAYQLFYEWTHYISHRPIKPLTPWGQYMKKFHLLHHYKSDQFWFGVTHAALDRVAHTSPDAKHIHKVAGGQNQHKTM